MSRKRNMPSKLKILNYWKVLYKKKCLTEEICFKCGYDGYVERAHITSVYSGGSDDVSNLHLLCKNCHNDSEAWEYDVYHLWFDYENKNRYEFITHLTMTFIQGKIKLKGDLKRDIDKYINGFIDRYGKDRYNEIIKKYKL